MSEYVDPFAEQPPARTEKEGREAEVGADTGVSAPGRSEGLGSSAPASDDTNPEIEEPPTFDLDAYNASVKAKYPDAYLSGLAGEACKTGYWKKEEKEQTLAWSLGVWERQGREERERRASRPNPSTLDLSKLGVRKGMS